MCFCFGCFWCGMRGGIGLVVERTRGKIDMEVESVLGQGLRENFV